MNPAVRKEYNTITHALESGNLLAVTKDGFKEIGFLGRVWRHLTGLGKDKYEIFEDCLSTTVGNKIVDFVRKNAQHLNPEQRKKLLEDVKALHQRLQDACNNKNSENNFGNIGFNIVDINDIYKKNAYVAPK